MHLKTIIWVIDGEKRTGMIATTAAWPHRLYLRRFSRPVLIASSNKHLRRGERRESRQWYNNEENVNKKLHYPKRD